MPICQFRYCKVRHPYNFFVNIELNENLGLNKDEASLLLSSRQLIEVQSLSMSFHMTLRFVMDTFSEE